MNNKLIIISNRLPLTIELDDQNCRLRPSSGGLISAINAYLRNNGKGTFKNQVWAGYPDCSEETWQKAFATTPSESAFSFAPVFINQKVYQSYYNGFSNSLLWPLFHYFPSFAEYNDNDFETYMQVNNLFAETISTKIQKGDTVWIHDYHLLPLAGLLRKRFPDLTIGFFLHIPFPSYELFRVIPKIWQQELLKGMAGADLIGFHTIDYAAHFLSCIERVLKIEHDGQSFLFNGRLVKADAFPISIDFDLFNDIAGNKEVESYREEYLELKGDKKMIFSVDRLDYTKGLNNRLRAYHKFLIDYPEYIGKVTFVLVVVPSRDEIAKYAEKKKAIDEYIGNMNSSLGDIAWQPVLYHYNHLPFDELLALYTTCDLALITPLRDGMNLVAKEFVASRKDQQGVLILSEMTGAARELTEAILINPNDITEIAEAIKMGLEMPESEQQERMSAMQQVIRNYNVNNWAADFFANLISVKSRQADLQIRYLDSFAKAKLLEDYAKSWKRLLLLDYDGTLIPFSKKPADAVPTAELFMALKEILANNRNDVYIISGRDSATLESWLGNLPIGLIAEHGAKIKHPGGYWQNEIEPSSNDWMARIRHIMELQSAKCANSFIEQKEFSLAWHYRNAELVGGALKAKELYSQLLEITAHLPLNVLSGNKVIEVRYNGIDKGKAAEKVLNLKTYDFVLCIGDDQTDEDMFKKLAYVPHAYTLKVGTDRSFATYNVQSPNVVLSLIETIPAYPDRNKELWAIKQ
jgi:trehalose 6-phosphate synthase/phosphatase